ncbi:hypothetical protein DFH28DRAFT_927109 [Melampsora americana]|nr:hypothetical protein DFH28DRAFT_927109 [Melampsora americana]
MPFKQLRGQTQPTPGRIMSQKAEAKTNMKSKTVQRRLPKHFEGAKERTVLAGKHAALSSWAEGTLGGYFSGMSNFIEFKVKKDGSFNENLPISDEDIYGFIAWAGESKAKKENGPD